MYYRRSIRPETFSEALGGLPYRAVLDKYWVDELYGLVFVRGTLAICFSRRGSTCTSSTAS
jgi:hypothetical protein